MDIRGLLQKEQWYTKEEMQEKTGILDERRMIQHLFQILEQDISSFSYDKDYTYLFSIFDYFEEWLEEDSTLFSSHSLERLERFHDELKACLITKPGSISKKDGRFQVLKQLLFQIESLSIRLAYDEQDHRLKGIYPIVSSLVFDVCDLTYVDSLFRKFPGAVNCKDEDGTFLIENVMKAYLSSLEEKNRERIIYFDSILELVMCSKQFHFLSIDRDKWKKEIRNRMNQFDHDDDSYPDQIFFLGSLKRLLLRNKYLFDTFDVLCQKYQVSNQFDSYIDHELAIYDTDYFLGDLTLRKKISSFVMAIDSQDAHEIDDALSIDLLDNGHYLVGVHISNVTGYLPYSSLTVEEAKKRTTSIYLSDRTIPMFPSYVSKDKWSLSKDQPRLTHSYYFDLSPSGMICDYRFYKSFLSLSYQATYEEVDSILKEGKEETTLEKTCHMLLEASNLIAKNFHISKWYTFSKQTHTRSSKAEEIVTNMMLLTNKTIAEHFAYYQYPLIRRVHEIEPSKKLEIEALMQKLPEGANGEKMKMGLENLLLLCPPAFYGSSGKHDGLLFEHYCHATSPLRRFPDVLVEKCMDLCYFQKPTDQQIYFLEREIQAVSHMVNEKKKTLTLFAKRYEQNKNVNK